MEASRLTLLPPKINADSDLQSVCCPAAGTVFEAPRSPPLPGLRGPQPGRRSQPCSPSLQKVQRCVLPRGRVMPAQC